MNSKKIGIITHYFDKIGVCVIKLAAGDIKVDDEIEIVEKGGNSYRQKVESMQIEHADIEIAKTGDEFGLKVSKAVKAGNEVFKVGK